MPSPQVSLRAPLFFNIFKIHSSIIIANIITFDDGQSFFFFFSIIVYHRILYIVPHALQKDLVVYPYRFFKRPL